MKSFFIKLLLLLTVLLGLLYLVGIIYFSDHFLFNTKINNLDVSLNSPDNTNIILSSKHPSITIIQKNKDSKNLVEESIDLIDEANGDIIYDSKNLLSEQNNYLWFTSLFDSRELSCEKVSGNIDADELNKAIEKLYCLQEKNIVKPIDAHYEIKDGKLEIVKEDDGCYIDKNTVMNTVKSFVGEYLNGSEISKLDLTSKYDNAKIKSDDTSLIAKQEELQSILDKAINIEINSNYTEVLNGASLINLLKVENNNIVVDETKLNEYVIELANNFDVSSNEYIDKGALKSSLTSILTNNQNMAISVSWIKTKQAHIEVSIGKQMLWYYEGDDLIMTSDFVSGYGDTATPQETFYIQHKKEHATLRGSDYVEEVDYWIGFGRSGSPYDGGHILGFHDASWRDEFGGEIYKTDPSHGCINMPLEKVRQLYELADIGTEVHIYE